MSAAEAQTVQTPPKLLQRSREAHLRWLAFLDGRHRALTSALGLLYAAPSLVNKALEVNQEAVPAILDLGTGSGLWAEDMARAFPHAQVVGSDVNLPTTTDATPSNCKLIQLDANAPLDQFARQFTIVHMRSLEDGIKDQHQLLHNVAHALKPGGILLLVAEEALLYSETKELLPIVQEGEPGWSAVQTGIANVIGILSRQGIDLNVASNWDKWLNEDPMYTDVGREFLFCPVGPWMTDAEPRWKDIGKYFTLSAENALKAAAGVLLKGGYGAETVAHLQSIAKQEITDMQPRALIRYRYMWATRTSEPWSALPSEYTG